MHFPGLIRAALAAALLAAPLPALAQASTYGSVTLKADPTLPAQAARKGYVDAQVAAAAANMANAANLASGVLAPARLPLATTAVPGAVIVGAGLAVSNGVLSSTGSGSVTVGTTAGTVAAGNDA